MNDTQARARWFRLPIIGKVNDDRFGEGLFAKLVGLGVERLS